MRKKQDSLRQARARLKYIKPEYRMVASLMTQYGVGVLIALLLVYFILPTLLMELGLDRKLMVIIIISNMPIGILCLVSAFVLYMERSFSKRLSQVTIILFYIVDLSLLTIFLYTHPPVWENPFYLIFSIFTLLLCWPLFGLQLYYWIKWVDKLPSRG